ncbi:MAG: four helix bundle protein [Planctomycetota bacterium]
MEDELASKTRSFSLRVIKLVGALNRNQTSRTLGNQVLRSATSIGAAYREAKHASSTKHFISIMEIAQRESNESDYWLDLIGASGLLPEERLASLREECQAIHKMLTAAILTAKRKR